MEDSKRRKIENIPLWHLSLASPQRRQMEKEGETNHSLCENLQRGVLESSSNGKNEMIQRQNISHNVFIHTNTQRGIE